MMIVGLLRHRNSKGFCTSTCSKIYSSVARFNRMSFDSDTITSICVPFTGVSQAGQIAEEKALLECSYLRAINIKLKLDLLN